MDCDKGGRVLEAYADNEYYYAAHLPYLTLPNTVDSRYLEIQGTLLNSSRYPYFDISDLQNWGKQLIEQPLLTEWIFNLTYK